MVEDFVKNILGQVVSKYPYLEHPAAMKAIITAVTETGTKKELECELTDKAAGETREIMISLNQFLYTVRVTDNDGMEQQNFPVFPSIHSYQRYEVGDSVVIVFTGGELQPVILGG